jgi:hypothetical protein
LNLSNFKTLMSSTPSSDALPPDSADLTVVQQEVAHVERLESAARERYLEMTLMTLEMIQEIIDTVEKNADQAEQNHEHWQNVVECLRSDLSAAKQRSRSLSKSNATRQKLLVEAIATEKEHQRLISLLPGLRQEEKDLTAQIDELQKQISALNNEVNTLRRQRQMLQSQSSHQDEDLRRLDKLKVQLLALKLQHSTASESLTRQRLDLARRYNAQWDDDGRAHPFAEFLVKHHELLITARTAIQRLRDDEPLPLPTDAETPDAYTSALTDLDGLIQTSTRLLASAHLSTEMIELGRPLDRELRRLIKIVEQSVAPGAPHVTACLSPAYWTTTRDQEKLIYRKAEVITSRPPDGE